VTSHQLSYQLVGTKNRLTHRVWLRSSVPHSNMLRSTQLVQRLTQRARPATGQTRGFAAGA
jgi:hypothetical protein